MSYPKFKRVLYETLHGGSGHTVEFLWHDDERRWGVIVQLDSGQEVTISTSQLAQLPQQKRRPSLLTAEFLVGIALAYVKPIVLKEPNSG